MVRERRELNRTWARVFSSRRKPKTWSAGTGSQTEVAAPSTTPLGCPGWAPWFMDTRTHTSLPAAPGMVVHWCCGDAVMLPQKLLTMRCDSAIMLRLPSAVTVNNIHHRG